MEKLRPRNSTNKPPYTFSVASWEAQWHAPRAYFMETLHLELCVKIENLFLEKHLFSGKF